MKFKDWIYHLKFRRQLRKIQRKYNAEKRRCARTYPDWEDNEFNDLDCKFIWGLTHNPKAEPYASFYTLNKAALYYNRRTERYILDIDMGFFREGSEEHLIKYLNEVREALNQRYKTLPDNTLQLDQIMNYGWFEDYSIEGIKRKFNIFCQAVENISKEEH